MVAQWKTPGPPRQTPIRIPCPICNTPEYSEPVLSSHLWTKHGNRNLLISTVIQLTGQLTALGEWVHYRNLAHDARSCLLCRNEAELAKAKQTRTELEVQP